MPQDRVNHQSKHRYYVNKQAPEMNDNELMREKQTYNRNYLFNDTTSTWSKLYNLMVLKKSSHYAHTSTSNFQHNIRRPFNLPTRNHKSIPCGWGEWELLATGEQRKRHVTTPVLHLNTHTTVNIHSPSLPLLNARHFPGQYVFPPVSHAWYNLRNGSFDGIRMDGGGNDRWVCGCVF